MALAVRVRGAIRTRLLRTAVRRSGRSRRPAVAWQAHHQHQETLVLTLSPIANLFWNARERRIRAGWRLLVFLVIVFLVAAVDGRVGAGLAGRLPDLYEGLVRALVFALLIAVALYLA